MNKTNKKSYGLIFILAILLAFPFNVVITNATPTKGSITIRKFDVNRYENLKESTGQASDEDNLPSSALEMAGIEFKVEKLLVEAGVTSVTPATPVDNSFTARIKQTDNDGVAIFDDLPLGYYLVTETIPYEYSSPEDGQFVIAIPITNEDSNGTKTITYDVVVFPKSHKILGENITPTPPGDNGTMPIPPEEDGIMPTPPSENGVTITPTPLGSLAGSTTPITTLRSGHTGSSSSRTGGRAMSAKTGDLTSVIGFIVLMIASSGIIMGVIKKRNR